MATLDRGLAGHHMMHMYGHCRLMIGRPPRPPPLAYMWPLQPEDWPANSARGLVGRQGQKTGWLSRSILWTLPGRHGLNGNTNGLNTGIQGRPDLSNKTQGRRTAGNGPLSAALRRRPAGPRRPRIVQTIQATGATGQIGGGEGWVRYIMSFSQSKTK